MSSLSVKNNFIAVSKKLNLDIYDNKRHYNKTILDPNCKGEDDFIHDLQISPDCKYLAAITSTSKQLIVYELPQGETKKFTLPRSASKVRFTKDSQHILVADKSGDALLYDINISDDKGIKLLGHLSLLLDILQTNDKKYIITSDRDEKIRVSCYPNTYNIQTYCLGHKEFVNHIELLPNNESYLTSTSGDGSIKIWNYINGSLCYSINTNQDIEDTQVLSNFKKVLADDGIEVDALPIVHFTTTKLNSSCSLLIVTVYSFNALLIYKLSNCDKKFTHELVERLQLDQFPVAIASHESSIYIFNGVECEILNIIQNNDKVILESKEKIVIFKDTEDLVRHHEIKVLYKRKYDNVQEYQERKKKRLDKSIEQ